MSDIWGAAQMGCGRSSNAAASVTLRLRALLLGGVAAGVVLASGVALAEDIGWNADAGGTWSEDGNWVGAVVPSSADTATVASGYVDVYGRQAAGTLNVVGGVVTVNQAATLDVDAVAISGDGNLNVRGGDDENAAGLAGVGSTITLSSGKLDGDGLVTVAAGDGHSFVQSGGEVGGMLTIEAPSYVLSGGAIGDAVTIKADSFSFEGGATSMQGTVEFSDRFSISPDSEEPLTIEGRLTGTGKLVKSGDSTVRLINGSNDFSGGVSVEGGVLEGDSSVVPRTGSIDVAAGAVFRNTGGDAAYSGTLGGDGTFALDSWDQFGVGGGTVEMGGLDVTQGTFRVGTKYFATEEESAAESIDAKFDHVHLGGDVPEDAEEDFREYGTIMVEHGSTLTADTFEMTAGHLWSEWNDDLEAEYPYPALIEGNVVANSFTQSGGLVDAIDIYAGDYLLEGGDSHADVTFSGTYRITGGQVLNGNIVGVGEDASMEQTGGWMWALNTDNIANYTLSGGDMQVHLGGLKKFTQSGEGRIIRDSEYGDGPGFVDTEVYELAGGIGYGFDDVTISKELIVSGTGDLQRYGIEVPTYTQTGGKFTGTMTVDDFNFSGGEFVQDGTVTISNSLTVSGGELALDGLGALDKFSLLGGKFTGDITTASYEYGGGQLVGTVDVGDELIVSGGVLTVGDGTVTLGREDQPFTVAVDAGKLNVIDAALPDDASVTVGADGTLQFTIGDDVETLFAGTMDGNSGSLVKDGGGTLTLTNNITLGDLAVNAGLLKIGDGTSTEKASFDSAVVAADASLYIAAGATLEIRVPNHLTNNGTLINDGTVIDDLDNTDSFLNNGNYDADVASNTGRIDNNEPGLWTGDILSNASVISNNQGATWDGAVKGNVANITNNGTWINGTVTNGVSTIPYPTLDYTKVIYNAYEASWTGDIAENYMWVTNAGGTWTGDILSNHAHIWNDNAYPEIGTGYWIGDVVRNDYRIFNGGGGDWTGDVIANGANGKIKNDGSTDDGGATWYGAWHGDVYGNAGFIENQGRWDGDVLGNAGTIYNSGSWEGDLVAAGSVTSVKTGNVPNTGNTGTINNTDADAIWTGDVLGNAASGVIIKGVDADWIGNVDSNAGTIMTAGTWTGSITSGGKLKAGGTITGSLNNAGTLELDGNLSVASASFGSASHLKVDIGADGLTEQLSSTGLAQLDGVVEVKAGDGLAEDDYLTPYTFLTAGSISGTFDGVTTDLAFLTPTLHYTGTTASLEFGRNDQSFSNTGVTGNQQAIGGAVEALGSGNDLYDAVIGLNAEQAQDAFDQLSGEAYASASGAAASNAALVGNLALDRIATTFNGVDSSGAASGYSADPALAADGSSGMGLWTQLYGAYGSADGSGGASGVEATTAGVAAGLDGLIGDWRVGVMFDAGASHTAVADLDSTIDSTDYGLGVYGGGDFSGTRLTLAGTYTRHDNSSSRSVDFPDFSDALSASYASATWQLGGQLSHDFDFGAFSIAPYAGAGYVNHQTDAFSETGGAAALSYAAGTIAQTTATIGTTVGYQTVVGDGMLLTANASVGWRHAFGEAPDAEVSLGGGGPVTVIGTAAMADLATLGAGLNLDVNDATTLDLSYDGELSAHNQTHAVTGTWMTRF